MENKFAGLPKLLKSRSIRGLDIEFTDKWALGLAQWFNSEPAASGITYRAIYTFDGLEGAYEGTITINRDGGLVCKLVH